MKIKNFFIAFLAVSLLWILIYPDILEARGGRGFGGSRSFGRSRSFGGSRSYTRSRSYSSPATRQSVAPRTSFGGTRLSSSQQYTSRYGTPRKTIPAGTMSGVPRNYVVNDYGGFGSGLMMGYMMGHTSWMWSMPFHPAFYYGRPHYVENPDGTMSVYPPTFSFTKLIFTILIIGAIIYIIYVIIRNRRRANYYSQSSFS